MKKKSSFVWGGLFLISGAAALAAYGLQTAGDPLPTAKTTAASEVSTGEPAGKTLTLNVPGMHCEFACAPKVRQTLAAVPGVNDVATSVEDRTATIAIGDGFDLGTALAKLDEAGYPAEAR